MIAYKTVTSDDRVDFDTKVNDALANGWGLYGETQMAGGDNSIIYLQAFVKKTR